MEKKKDFRTRPGYVLRQMGHALPKKVTKFDRLVD